jgi:hypothetical protein
MNEYVSEIDGWFICSKWAVIAPLHATLFYTIPNCKVKQNLFLVTFFMSILWTAIFSYVMVWMVSNFMSCSQVKPMNNRMLEITKIR